MKNIYPIWWDTSITLFNKYEDPITQLVTWYKTVITNCFIQSAKSMVVNGQVTYDTDSIIVRVPENTNFKEFGEWISIPNVDMKDYFTIHSGDIVIKGEVPDTIDEYQDGMRSTDLIEKYKRIGMCLTIDKWQNNTGIGRICPHYFISGE